MYYGRKGLSLFGKLPSEADISRVTVLRSHGDKRLRLDAGLAHMVVQGRRVDYYLCHPVLAVRDLFRVRASC